MNKNIRLALGLLTLVGLGVSLYLTYTHYRLMTDPAFASACKLSETLDCDKVNTSRFAKVFGLPLGLYGAAFYAAMLALVAMSFSTRDKFKHALELLFGFSVLSVLLSLGLAYISMVEVKAFCIMCITLYAVNLGIFALSYLGSEGAFRQVLGRLNTELAGFLRSPMLYVAGLIFFGGVFLGGSAFTRLENDAQLEQAKKFLAAHNSAERATPKAAPPAGADRHDNPQDKGSSTEAAPTSLLEGKQVDVHRYGHEPIRGNPKATVELVIFSDFECPHCSLAGQALDEVVKAVPDKVVLVYKHYPLDMECNPYITRPFHQFSCKASVAAICAQQQGQFWEMHDSIFRQQTGLSEQILLQSAKDLGLNMNTFVSCLVDRNNALLINRDIEQGKAAGIGGTPTIFINGQRWGGAPRPDALVAVINELAGG